VSFCLLILLITAPADSCCSTVWTCSGMRFPVTRTRSPPCSNTCVVIPQTPPAVSGPRPFPHNGHPIGSLGPVESDFAKSLFPLLYSTLLAPNSRHPPLNRNCYVLFPGGLVRDRRRPKKFYSQWLFLSLSAFASAAETLTPDFPLVTRNPAQRLFFGP